MTRRAKRKRDRKPRPDGQTTSDAGSAAAKPQPVRSVPVRAGEKWRHIALVVLLAAVASRCFIAELPFESSALTMLTGQAHAAAELAQTTLPKNTLAYQPDLAELARVSYAISLLAAGVLWLVGGAIDRKLAISHPRLVTAIALFGALSLASAMAASNRRAALDGWIEQLSLMFTAFLAIQLCTSRRRLMTLAVVLAAMGVAMAVMGYWQVFIEAPQNAEYFHAHRIEQFQQFGWDPNSPQARLIEARVRDWSAKGFLGLANPFGSMLIVLGFAAFGLAAEKFRAAAAVRCQAKAPTNRKPGEIDPAILAAVAAALAAVATLAVIALTQSQGAMLGAAVAGAALLAAMKWRDALARHWRKWIAGAIVAAVLAGAALTLYGLRNDRLPTKTMTFRWYYWTASAKIFAERPLLGTGPGNFADAYLRNRRPRGEEEIQMPHNFLVHALSVCGTPGGACYLFVLGWLMLLAVRPGSAATGEPLPGPGPTVPEGTRPWLVWAIVVAAMLAARIVFGHAGSAPYVILMLQTVLPAIVLAGMLAVLGWPGRDPQALAVDARPNLVRMALAASAVGFLVHNIVSYSLWLPSTASVFYLAIGAAAAGGGKQDATEPQAEEDGGSHSFSNAGLAVLEGLWASRLAVVAGAGLIAAIVLLWLPVATKTYHTAGMLSALEHHDPSAALRQAAAAVKADTLAPRPAADAAEVTMIVADRTGADRTRAIRTALAYARQAVRRDPAHAAYHRLVGELTWSAVVVEKPEIAKRLRSANDAYRTGDANQAAKDWKEAATLLPAGPNERFGVKSFARAVLRNPQSARLRIAFADNLLNANLPRQAVPQLSAAWQINEDLPADSVQRLRPAELMRIRMLTDRAAVLMGRQFPSTTTQAIDRVSEGAPPTKPAD